MEYSFTGGADGPTSIFLAGKLGISWLNLFGLMILVFLMIPNIIYAVKFHGSDNRSRNRTMNLLEQIGRYASMFLMVFNIGIAEFGFSSVALFLVYLAGNILLLLIYWIIWFLFFIEQKTWKSMALAIIPAVIFLISGITLRHYLLIFSAVLFGVGHICITWQNTDRQNHLR